MVVLTSLQFILIVAAIFLALCAAPALSDYVYFVLDPHSTWVTASIGTAILCSAFIAVVTRIVMRYL